MQMEDKVYGIILSILEEKNKNISIEMSTDTRLRRDLEFDSLDLAVLTVRIEDEFDVDIFEDELIDTVAEIIVKIQKRG